MCASALTRPWPARPAVNLVALRRVITAGATVGVVGTVSIPVVNSARAAWLFVGFIPICTLAGTAAALARRIVDEDIS